MPLLQNQYIPVMIDACKKSNFKHWNSIEAHAENEFRSLVLMLKWLNEMRTNKEMTTEEARIHIDIQKNTMRTRLMALPNITMVESEHIINKAIDSIRPDLYAQMDWIII